KIPTAKLPAVLNRQLPSDIRIKKAETVTGANFHPRYSARVRQYRYILLKHLKNRYNADLFLNRFSWHPGIELDKKTVTQLLRPLTGIHDFTTFCAADDSSAVKLREIFKIEVKQKPGALFIDIYGNAFLKAMVRSIIGNMIHTIKNNKPGTYLKHILLKQDRRLAKQRAPACGLTLMRVYYRKIFGERDYYKRT
ncbi:MAG TPA: hypothetical protein VKS21_03725, partial [Spirochaetota bacterium]|nr:hypothetical protein [Spirochaetota bacterium]